MTSLTTEAQAVPDESLYTSDDPAAYSLRRIMPDDIAAAWPQIKIAVAGTLPARVERTEAVYNTLLDMMQKGGMVPWVLVKDKQPHAILVTTKQIDGPSGSCCLFVYTFYAFEPIPLRVIADGYLKLSNYARSIGCHAVTMETSRQEVIDLVRRINPESETETRILTMPLAPEETGNGTVA